MQYTILRKQIKASFQKTLRLRDENNPSLTTTAYTLYTAPTVRTSYSTIPTSTITACAVVADGYTLTRSAHPCLWLICWDPSQATATRPLALQKDGTWYTYGWDLTKNICEVFGQHGYIRTAYTYAPFGQVTEAGDVTQPIQWSSEYHDTELTLVYYNYRHYNPLDGRWLGRDRITGINLYASNYLVYRNDSLGLFEINIITSYYYKVFYEDGTIFNDVVYKYSYRGYIIDEELIYKHSMKFKYENGKIMHEPSESKSIVKVHGKENTSGNDYQYFVGALHNPVETTRKDFENDIMFYSFQKHIFVKSEMDPISDNNGGYNIRYTAEAIALKEAESPNFQQEYMNEVINLATDMIPYSNITKTLLGGMKNGSQLYYFPEKSNITTCIWLKLKCSNNQLPDIAVISKAQRKDLQDYKIKQIVGNGLANFYALYNIESV